MKLPLHLVLSGGLLLASPVFHSVGHATEAAAASVPANEPPGWPREVTSEGVLLTIYQPQVDEWKDARLLKARAAFIMTPGKGKPVVGIMEIEGATAADLESRTVVIRDLKLTAVRFPS